MNPLLPRIVDLHREGASKLTVLEKMLVGWAKTKPIFRQVLLQAQLGLENARGRTAEEKVKNYLKDGINWSDLPIHQFKELLQKAMEDKTNEIRLSSVMFNADRFWLEVEGDAFRIQMRFWGNIEHIDTELPEDTFEDDMQNIMRFFGAKSPTIYWEFDDGDDLMDDEKQVVYVGTVEFPIHPDALVLALISEQSLLATAQKVLEDDEA